MESPHTQYQQQQQQQQQQPHHYPSHQSSPSQALPSITSLTNGLPPTSQPSPHGPPPRDSGAWLNSQSKHTSANSGLHVSTLLNPDESVRGSVPSTPTSSRLSHLSHLSHTNQLPSIHQGPEANRYRDSRDGARQSVEYHNAQESRRSSVDSRMHTGFNSLAINPLSPHENPNSQLSPINSRSHSRQQDLQRSERVAPPIVPNPRQYGAPDPTSSRPVQGFPWAFPDSVTAAADERPTRRASSSESSESQKMSRQGSFAASSIRSSAMSADVSIPPGQRKFEDGMAFQKIIGPIGEEVKSPDGTLQHHPSMQHRSITNLQAEHNLGASPGGYSRTPELRVSHKLAERKRRSEMKDLFEDLNKAVPTNGGAKASKWEILSKAIDYIRSQREQERHMHDELQRLRRDGDYARELHKEHEQLRTELCIMHERLRRLEPNNPHVYGAFSSHLAQQQGQAPPPPPPPSQPQHMGNLPPMHATHPAHPASHPQQQHQPSYAPPSAPMQGVEYALPNRPGYGEAR